MIVLFAAHEFLHLTVVGEMSVIMEADIA